MKRLLIGILLLITTGLCAQKKYKLEYTIYGFSGDKAVLKSMYGSVFTPLDSCKVIDGFAHFSLDSGMYTGMYRIQFNDSIFTDIIFNNEDIVLSTEVNNMLVSMNVEESYENMILFSYWEYAISVKDSVIRLSMEAQKAIRRDGGSPGKNYQQIQNRVFQLNESVRQYAESLGKMYPDRFAPILLKAYQKPDYNTYMRQGGAVPYPDEKEYYRVHFFDNFDFSRPGLVRTNVVYTAINDYFSNFGQPATTDTYIRNIDFILSRLKLGDEAYEYGLDLFINNFETSIFEKVYIHLIENHYALYPKADKVRLKSYLQHIEIMKKLEQGNYAPNVMLKDTLGNSFLLYDLMAEAKLLFFWSPGCEHCEDLMPELMEIYELYKSYGLEVIAIAITPDESYWKSVLRKFNSKWVNVSDLQGMESPVATQYNIWMTPLLYVLDKNNKITGRPRSIPEVHARLVELLPLD